MAHDQRFERYQTVGGQTVAVFSTLLDRYENGRWVTDPGPARLYTREELAGVVRSASMFGRQTVEEERALRQWPQKPPPEITVLRRKPHFRRAAP